MISFEKYDHLLEQVNNTSTPSQRIGACYSSMAELGLNLHRCEMILNVLDQTDDKDFNPLFQAPNRIALVLLNLRRAVIHLGCEEAVEEALNKIAEDLHQRVLKGEMGL